MKTAKIFLSITIVFFIVEVQCQTALLNQYNFDNGNYTLLGTKGKSDPHELSESLGEWYTNDIEVLNEIKKKWVFKEPSPQYLCGYHYVVYICKNGNPLESFYINLNCNEIVGEKGYFYFDVSKLRAFKEQFKKPKIQNKTFSDINKARKFRNKILQNKSLIMSSSPQWTTFEGCFGFDYSSGDNDEDYFEKSDSLLAILKKEITQEYPGEEFILEVVGSAFESLEVRINCNKSLNDKFNLYPINWRKWKYFKLDLISYWKNE